MSNEYVVTEKQILTDMANTVREATGSTTTYNVPELMTIAAAIVENGGSSANAVLYTEQTLTEEQKTQARVNIGAHPAGDYVTPQMYGAVGDGVVDDTVALQNAFNDVAANGRYLFIPKGRYKVTAPITVDWSSTSATKRNFLQKIIGAGSQAFEKNYDNSVIVGYNIPAYRGVIELIGNGNTWGTETRIEDLGIECNEASCDPMSFALRYGDARNFKLSRVKLRGHNAVYARCGSIVDESGNSITKGYEQINVKFEQCDFYVFPNNTKGFAFLPEGVVTGQHATMDNIVVDSCCIGGVWVVTSVNILFQSCQICINNVASKEITTNNIGKLNGYEVDYATGFYVGQAMSAVFQNLYFEDHRRSFQITPTLGSIRNVSIMNCYLNPGCNQFNADGSRLCADYGIRINPGKPDGYVRNVLVQNNVFRLVEGDTEFTIANVSNECAEHFVFRDNCTTSTLEVPKVINTTTSGYDIQNGVDEGASVKSMSTSADGKTFNLELTNGKSASFDIDASTPIKGIDYFTEAEIGDITDNAADLAKAQLQQIAPPTWVESVEDMTDTSKHYVLQSSGNIWAYMKKTKTVGGSKVPNFTNLMEDSNAYIKNGYRYSHSSQAFKESTADCAIVVPVPNASSFYIRIRGATFEGCNYPGSVYLGVNNQAFPGTFDGGNADKFEQGTNSNGDLYLYIKQPPTESVWGYVVFHVASGVNVDDLIVTVNEEITYTETSATTTTVTEWTDTGKYAVEEGEITEGAVLYIKQTPTEGQKVQARENIGAVGIDELNRVTPQMYGAVGDGITDDTIAFKNAISANDYVFVPQGNYLITDTLDISYKKSLVSDDGQKATILYNGNNSVVSLGRFSVFRNINITIKNAFAGIVFDTNNYNKNSGEPGLGSRVEHVNVDFEVEAPNATLIGITVDSGTDVNNIPRLTGVCFQTYHDIHVDNSSQPYGYGIKMELIQGRPFTEATKDGFPWITHINYNDISLAHPHTAIKSLVTNNSGSELFERVNIGHILFDNVYSQCLYTEKTRYFLDLAHIVCYFTKCMPWDYHYYTWNGEKLNIIGENVAATFSDCEMFSGAEFLKTCDFPAETEFNVTDNPGYFMNKYFRGTILSEGYDGIDAKIDAKLSGEFVANVAEEKINDILYSGYTNLMDNPLTQIKVHKRWSSSNNEWVEQLSGVKITTVIIPIVQGGNIIRWTPSTIGNQTNDYATMYFFNDDNLATSMGKAGTYADNWVSDGGYLQIENPNGYKYVSIPFNDDMNHDWSSETIIMTINREITDSNSKSYTEYLKESVIIPELSEYALKSSAETWTFTLEDGTTVTKKVVLA